MKRLLSISLFITIQLITLAQHANLNDSIPSEYFVTHSKAEWMQKAVDLGIGIELNDSISVVISKIENFLESFTPNEVYPDDYYAIESIIQTIHSFKEGGYGIGAILVDSVGKIISENHNCQIQRHRSDLHAEMTLLTDFEETDEAKDYMNVFIYKPGLTVYSSAEPCPMCLIRLAAAGVNTKYVTSGPDDGMANRIYCLPASWRDLAYKYPCVKAKSSPVLQKIAHLMFFSFLLDNRGPH
jgi:tRNA(Arg) A34 adenosine deaminase TadA